MFYCLDCLYKNYYSYLYMCPFPFFMVIKVHLHFFSVLVQWPELIDSILQHSCTTKQCQWGVDCPAANAFLSTLSVILFVSNQREFCCINFIFNHKFCLFFQILPFLLCLRQEVDPFTSFNTFKFA